MSLWAIVPVKPLRRGKSRLANVLTEEERTHLNYTMLVNTLKALTAVKEIDCVIVVSRDTGVLALARDFNARTVQEDGSLNLNLALQNATVIAQFFSAESVLILPSDLPLITPDSVRKIIEPGGNPPVVVISPDRRMDGTNALLINPTGILEYSFGIGSFQRHIEQARRYNIRVELCNIPEISLDLDLPEDLDYLREIEKSRIPQCNSKFSKNIT